MSMGFVSGKYYYLYDGACFYGKTEELEKFKSLFPKVKFLNVRKHYKLYNASERACKLFKRNSFWRIDCIVALNNILIYLKSKYNYES